MIFFFPRESQDLGQIFLLGVFFHALHENKFTLKNITKQFTHCHIECFFTLKRVNQKQFAIFHSSEINSFPLFLLKC